nr:hypothetical protein GCM10025730_01670 [Promicromonospora thailandica]
MRQVAFVVLVGALGGDPFETSACRATAAASGAKGGTLPQYSWSDVKPQLTGAERPTPRGSMPITS